MVNRHGRAAALALTTLLLCVTTSARAAVAPPQRESLDRGSATGVLVHVSSDADLHAVIGAVEAMGIPTGSRYERIDVFVARPPRALVPELLTLPGVLHVEANRVLDYHLDTAHEATRVASVVGAGSGRFGRIDGSGVGVAVIDTGVDGTHPDLQPNMHGNVRIVCSSPGVLPYVGGQPSTCRGEKQVVELADTDTPGAAGHGTHVAGAVAAAGEVTGSAPGAALYGVGIGTVVLVENALDGLEWVLDNHDKVTPAIRVVNNSWGGGHARADDPHSLAITKLVDELVAEGLTVVFAAGNDGGVGAIATTSVQCVNPTPGVICVANYDDANSGTREGEIWESSSRGARDKPWTWPDVAAPGTAIRSTCRPTLPICLLLGDEAPEPFHSTLTGSSMAAPQVSGIAALLYQAAPELTPAEVEMILERTAYEFSWGGPYKRDPFNPLSASSFDKGHGLVDAYAALAAVTGKRRSR